MRMNCTVPPEYKGVILNEIPDDYPLFKESMGTKMGHIAIVIASTYVVEMKILRARRKQQRVKGKKTQWG